jgi:hypothetical protein
MLGNCIERYRRQQQARGCVSAHGNDEQCRVAATRFLSKEIFWSIHQIDDATLQVFADFSCRPLARRAAAHPAVRLDYKR